MAHSCIAASSIVQAQHSPILVATEASNSLRPATQKDETMTYASDILHGRDPWVELKAALAARWSRYSAYRATLSELSALSTKELADIGLNRSQIRSVAFEHAYGPEA